MRIMFRQYPKYATREPIYGTLVDPAIERAADELVRKQVEETVRTLMGSYLDSLRNKGEGKCSIR